MKEKADLGSHFVGRKSLLHPPTYRGWNTSPPTYETGLLPLNFLKRDKSPPEAVLKNHKKS
jgi:hypothetical protein